MRSASIAGHPLHPALVGLPIGLWVFSFVCDIVALVEGNAFWQGLALYTLVGGLVGAMLAAIPGLIDWFSLGTPEARTLGTIHMILNVGLLILYSVNATLRILGVGPAALPFALTVLGVMVLGISGWLGGEMVFIHRAGVTSPASRSRLRRPRQAA